MTRIISAFPGTGKTTYHEKHPDTTLDSDSSNFSWINYGDKPKVRNPDFPQNYIDHIRENIGKYEIIFVSTHEEVREALIDNCLFFHLICPDMAYKELYLKRYIDRGSPESFIKLLNDNWEAWINGLWEYEHCYECRFFQMVRPNLEDNIKFIEAENN